MFPRWLSWLFVVFLAYIIFTANWDAPVGPTPAPAPQAEEAPRDYTALRALMDGERWKRSLNPHYTEAAEPCAALAPAEGALGSYAIIEQEGDGPGAACQNRATFTFTPWKADARAAASHTQAITLGEQPGLDALLRGMRPGETRLLVFTAPKEGYAPLPFVKKGTLQLLRATRQREEAGAAP